MEQPIIAVYDANVLYPAPLRDLFSDGHRRHLESVLSP
jgi:hypothetical protein